MARTFNPLNFLRHAPRELLREYFAKLGVLGDFTVSDETRAELILEAINTVPDDERGTILHDFREIHLRSRDNGFVRAVLDEARFHKTDAQLAEIFADMRNALQKAFWVFLHRRDEYWDGATVMWRVDKITGKNRWDSRVDLPARPGPVDEAMVHELQTALIRHFSLKEARGHRCKVESYRRGEEELFYAYPEDYGTTFAEYSGDELAASPVKPAFEIIFRHVDKDRQLDIFTEGTIPHVGELQVIFSKAILHEDIDPEYELQPPAYDLDRLAEHDFDFEWPEDAGIDAVHVKVLRAVLATDVFQRITAEVDPSQNERAAIDLLRSAASAADSELQTIDHAVLRVMFNKGPGERRTRGRTVRITSPHTCHMDHDEWGEKIHEMLRSSGIEITTAQLQQVGIDGSG